MQGLITALSALPRLLRENYCSRSREHVAPFQHGDVQPLTAAAPAGFVGRRALSPGACAGVGELPGLLGCCGTSSPAPALLQPQASLPNGLSSAVAVHRRQLPAGAASPGALRLPVPGVEHLGGAPRRGILLRLHPRLHGVQAGLDAGLSQAGQSCISMALEAGHCPQVSSLHPFVGHPQPGAMGAGGGHKWGAPAHSAQGRRSCCGKETCSLFSLPSSTLQRLAICVRPEKTARDAQAEAVRMSPVP